MPSRIEKSWLLEAGNGGDMRNTRRARASRGSGGDGAAKQSRRGPVKGRSGAPSAGGGSHIKGDSGQRQLAARLRRAEEQLVAQEETIEALRAEIAAMRRARRERRPKRDPKLVAKWSPTKSKRTGSTGQNGKRGGASSRRSKKLDVNRATFEQLRRLGLSVTQSKRLIGARETRDGFRTLDELDELGGFSAVTIAELKRRLTATSARAGG